MRISINDIKSSAGMEVNANGFITYDVGNNRSGEGYNQGVITLRQPGVISRPNGPGSFNSNGQFTNTISSPVSAKAITIENSMQWQSFGIMDIRSSALAGPCAAGETKIIAEALPQSQVYLDINGNITMTNNQNGGGTGARIQISQDNVITQTINGESTYISSFSVDTYQILHQYGNFTISSSGISMANATGTGGISIDAAGNVTISGLTVTISGGIVSIGGMAGTFIGPAATPITTAAYFPAPGVTLPVPSATVFISP